MKRQVRRRKILAGVLAGKSGTQAAIDAGVPPASAAVRASEVLSEPGVREQVARALDKYGAKIEDSARVIGEAHRATTPKTGFGGKESPDHAIRLDAAKTNMKLRGAMDPKMPTAGEVLGFAAIVGLVAAEAQKRGLAIPVKAERESAS